MTRDDAFSLPMGPREAKAIAEAMRVDEVFTFFTLEYAVGIGVRIGSRVCKTTVPWIEIKRASSPRERLMLEFSDLAARAIKLSRYDEPVTFPLENSFEYYKTWIDYVASTVTSVYGLPREVIGGAEMKAEPERKLASRFEAIGEEIKETTK